MTVLDVGGVNGDNDGGDGDYGGGGGGDDDDWWNQMEDPSSSGHYNLNTSVTWTIYNLGARDCERQDCEVRIWCQLFRK